MKQTEKWRHVLETVDYAFQPIVNLQTGETYAVEALVRNVVQAGFPKIEDFFDAAYREGVLFKTDIELRRKAIHKFQEIDFYHDIKLFYNYDPRILEMPDYRFGVTEEILKTYGLTNDMLCFELNERHDFSKFHSFHQLITGLKERGLQLALDDFGAGFSSFELFYNSEPDCLKFDRFLIQDIDKDFKKQTFCSYIVNMAKILGVLAVAEGVETASELEICKKIGFDAVQGFFIQRPTQITEDIMSKYPQISGNFKGTRSAVTRDFELITREMIPLDTININDSIKVLFDKFHDNQGLNYFPVLEKTGFPLGIIHERNIKKYVYSPYGRDLLYNKSITSSLRKFLSACPICDINTPQEKILEVYINNPDSEGVIITKDQKYYGFLTAKSLLTIINEKNLALAREVNPLTKLPGNMMINQFIAKACGSGNIYYYLIYFDLDNFKPFNDRFGFTRGDQAIILLADLLKKVYHGSESFIGHIGGDDFFVGLQRGAECLEDEYGLIEKVMKLFSQSARLFYAEKEVQKGSYCTKDRRGRKKEFPLLSVSAAVLEISPSKTASVPEEIARKLAALKKEAKLAGGSQIVVTRFGERIALAAP